MNVQNKNFIGFLRKLDVDLNRFNDKTFDGLFYNSPDNIIYFFNWFMENITTDNALTNLEQAMYFELEINNMLPSEEEINAGFSSCNFTCEELFSLDNSYIDSLAERLEDLKNDFKELNDVSSNLECCHSEVKKKIIHVTENSNLWKKKLTVEQNKCNEINILYSDKLVEAKEYLQKAPCVDIDLNSHCNLGLKEKNLFEMLENNELFKNEIFTSQYLNLLPQLKEDLACVQSYLIYSQGILKDKKTRIFVLSEFLQKNSSEDSISNSINLSTVHLQTMNMEHNPVEIAEIIHNLEKEIHKKVKILSHEKTQEILSQYLYKQIDLNNLLVSKLNTCKNYLSLNQLVDETILSILNSFLNSFENTLQIRKELHTKLTESEKNSSNNIINFEMRNKRFKEIFAKSDHHPFYLALKSIFKIEESSNYDENYKKIIAFLAIENETHFSHKYRIDLKTKVKSLLGKELYGPTCQLLFVPVDLYVKFKNFEKNQDELSHKIKYLANNYIEVKKLVSKKDRKKTLLWIDFLTNPDAFLTKMKNE